MLNRRHILASALAAPAILRFGTGTAQAATTLKISHQFPGGTIDKGDFRDRLCRTFAAEVAKRSGGEIAAEVYPNSSLIKTNAQFSAMRKGALDISLYPLPYAGGELPETNIGLMPGLVSTYDQGLRWKNQPVGSRHVIRPSRHDSLESEAFHRAADRSQIPEPVVDDDDCHVRQIPRGTSCC